jgi:hypothetical protein
MLIRLLIRYYKFLILLLMPLSINAKEINYTPNDFNKSAVENIDQFFLQNPTENNVIWVPKIKGKSRYAFSIQKDAYLISKKHEDASDLYYLSEQIDDGLTFHKKKSKSINMIISENNSYLILSQSILSTVNGGFFLKNKEKLFFGLNLNKDVILSQNVLGNFGIEQAINDYTALNAKFVKLSNNENSEFYGNINHEIKSDILNLGIGYTWFEIANQFDLTAGIQKQNKKVEADLHATFGFENTKFQIGLSQTKNNSNTNLFFNLKFENSFDKKNFGTNVLISSKDNILGLRNLSLKSFRRKHLDILWKKYINYN